jgi:glycosyltransferase 2 family protein
LTGRTRIVALQALVSTVALGAVAWWATRQPLPHVPDLATAVPRLAAAVGLYAVATALRSERWLALLRHGGHRAGRTDAYALTTVGYMGNNALPARAGDVLKAVLTAPRVGAPRTQMFGTVVAERLLDVAALALLFAALVTTLRLPLGVPGWVVFAIGAGLLVAAAAAVWVGRGTTAGRRARAVAGALLTPTRRLWSVTGAALLGISLAVWLLEGSVYAVLGPAAGIDLSLLDGLYVMALANLVALVPAAPGYVGTFDAAVVLGVRLVGGGARAAALGYVVLVRFVLFVPITVVGLVALVARYGGVGALRAAVRAPAPRPAGEATASVA